MRPFLTALALGLSLPLAALADSSGFFAAPDTAGLRAMLHRLPALMVGPEAERVEIGYGDLEAARALPGGVLRALPPGPLAQEMGGSVGTLRARVGFELTDVRRLILFHAAPLLASVYELEPGVAEAVPAALQAQGYLAEERMGLRALAAGEDGQIDLRARAPGDPFRGALGRSSRVQVEGAVLRHGSVWGLLGALQGAEAASARDEPGLAAMVGMLDGLGRGALLRAYLVPDAAGLAAGDPAALLRGQAPGGSALGWRSLLLADFSAGAESTAVLVMSLDWPEEAPVAPLAQAVARLWDEAAVGEGPSFATRLGVPVEAQAQPGPGGRALLRLVVTVPTGEGVRGVPQNPAFDALYRAAMQRQMVFLP